MWLGVRLPLTGCVPRSEGPAYNRFETVPALIGANVLEQSPEFVQPADPDPGHPPAPPHRLRPAQVGRARGHGPCVDVSRGARALGGAHARTDRETDASQATHRPAPRGACKATQRQILRRPAELDL